MTPGLAMMWQICRRFQWQFIGAAGYMALAIATVHVLPSHWKLAIPRGDEVPVVAHFVGISTLFVQILLVAAFAMTGNDAQTSGFTKHMFVLPVNTRALVTWPMVTGCLAAAGTYVVSALLVFRAGGIDAPLWGPAAAAAAFLASFQAVTWTPFAQRWVQALIVAPICVAAPSLWILAFAWDVPDTVIALMLLGFLPVAYIVALSGVARARRGQPYDSRIWNRLVEWSAALRSPATHPFSSARTAQIWFECRALAYMVPLFVGSILVFFWFVLFVEPRDVQFGWKLAGMMVTATMLVAMFSGAALGNLHDPFSKAESAAFVLTRPVSSGSLVKSKLAAAAFATAATWILVLITFGLLLLRPGLARSIADLASGVPAWKAILLPVVGLALLLALTWKNLIENLWVTLTGRDWVATAFGFSFFAVTTGGMGAGFWIFFHPDWQAAVWAAVPWLLGLLVFLKLVLAAIIVRTIDEARLANRLGIALMVGGWILIVSLLFLIAYWQTPSAFWSTSGILAAIVLNVPFSRIAGATLALDWNRHR